MTRDFGIALLVVAGLCFLVVIASEHRSAAYAMPLVSTNCIELHSPLHPHELHPEDSMKLFLALLALITAPANSQAAGKPLTLQVSSVTVDEGKTAAVTISKSGGNGRAVTVDWNTSEGSAKAPGDYLARSGRNILGSVPITVVVPTVDDSAVEGSESFSVTVKVVSGSVHPSAAGTVTIADNDVAPPAPPPPPAPTQAPAPTLDADNPMVGQSLGVGAPPIPTTDHDVMNDLMPSGVTHVPGEAKPDVLGAFRFVCRHNSSKFDDHLVFYGKPGSSHLHDSTGLYTWDAFTNYGNSRRGGGNSCSDTAGQDRNPAEITWAANRTSYVQPALLDGRGNVINADLTEYYYKRRPVTDPVVSDPLNPRYQGKAVTLPDGIKFIFGNHPENPSAPFDSANTKFMCTSSTVNFGSDMLGALKACQGASGQFEVRSDAPDCWDGRNLDSADHRSHVSYASYGSWGYLRCDAAHPYVIQTFTYAVQYTIAATDDVTKIHFSSDDPCMALGKGQGCSFHMDYGPKAWDPKVWQMVEDNCINLMLNCSGGDLGNGLRIKGAAQPIYLINGQYVPAWRNPQRLTPMPAMPVLP